MISLNWHTAHLIDTKPVDTPLELNDKYRRDEDNKVGDPFIYKHLVR